MTGGKDYGKIRHCVLIVFLAAANQAKLSVDL
jgi:hypothetical protein